jgi:hypothetical protein
VLVMDPSMNYYNQFCVEPSASYLDRDLYSATTGALISSYRSITCSGGYCSGATLTTNGLLFYDGETSYGKQFFPWLN